MRQQSFLEFSFWLPTTVRGIYRTVVPCLLYIYCFPGLQWTFCVMLKKLNPDSIELFLQIKRGNSFLRLKLAMRDCVSLREITGSMVCPGSPLLSTCRFAQNPESHCEAVVVAWTSGQQVSERLMANAACKWRVECSRDYSLHHHPREAFLRSGKLVVKSRQIF